MKGAHEAVGEIYLERARQIARHLVDSAAMEPVWDDEERKELHAFIDGATPRELADFIYPP